jgi:putative membrane protein
MLFIWNGSVIRAILPQLLVVLCISLFAVWTRGRIFGYALNLTVAPFTLLGVSLAIFLGFRNSASYDRFWEGRKLWGSLLNVCRSLMRQAQSIGETGREDTRLREWLALLAAFTHAMRHQLRKTDPSGDLLRLLSPGQCSELATSRYRPSLILLWLGQWVAEGKRQGCYGEITAAAMDSNLNALSDILGGCERLAHTPIPYAYSVMNHRVVYLYCFLLPFALVGEIGMMTPVMSVLVAYTFIAIEVLAQEIEEPFGVFANDLALENMSFNIEDSLRELAGEPLPPAAPPPRDYILL